MDISFKPLPLVIGVTGHRDLRDEDIPQLKIEIEKIFDRLDHDYANRLSHIQRAWRWCVDRARQRFAPGAPVTWPSATPMIVLSQLAEGADQLVAEVAVSRELRVIAPLPLPVEEYRRDFEHAAIQPDALRKFDDWMKRAGDGSAEVSDTSAGIQTLFVGYENGNSAENVHDFGKQRDLQYRRAGAFIARHCDVLIALWDGKPTEGVGGTAEIVDFKLNGIPLHAGGDARACLDAPEMGPVIHIVTPRATKSGTAEAVSVESWGDELVERYEPLAKQYDALMTRHAALKRRRRSATAAEKKEKIAAEMDKTAAEMATIKAELDPITADYPLWKSFEAPIRLSREFNRAATRFHESKRGRDETEKSFSYLFEINENKPETKAAADRGIAVARRYCDMYAIADALAIHWQKNVFRRDWFLLFAFGLSAFGCFEAYSHLAPIAHRYEMPGKEALDLALLFGYLFSFAAVVVMYFWATKWEHQERFLDYRALAEALRVAVFWRLAGIDGSADAYPIKLPRELAWVKTCLLVREFFDMVTPAGNTARPSLDTTSYDWIRNIWIKGQLDYFERTRHRHKGDAGEKEDWSKWILITVIVLAFVLLGLMFFKIIDREYTVHEVFLFVIGFLPGFAAVLVGYCEKLAFNAQARQYERMADLFRRAFNILPPQFNPDPANADLVGKVIRELGTEAMRDNAEWVSTYRERPFSLPQS